MYKQITITSWPSKDCLPAAVLRLEPTELETRLDIVFADDQDDLDYLKLAGLCLSTGEQVLLTRHRGSPSPGTVLHVDAGADKAAVLRQFFKETGIDAGEVAWRAEGAGDDKEEYESGPDGTTERDPYGG